MIAPALAGLAGLEFTRAAGTSIAPCSCTSARSARRSPGGTVIVVVGVRFGLFGA